MVRTLAGVPRFFDLWIFTILYSWLLLLRPSEIRRVQGHIHKSALASKPSLYSVYAALFCNGMDSLRILLGKNISYKISGQEALLNTLHAGKSAIVLSIHTGAFEANHRVLSQFQFPTYVLTAPFPQQSVQNVLDFLRSSPQIHSIHPEKGAWILRKLRRQPGILALMVDQSRWGTPEMHPFLGRDNGFWLDLPRLAEKLGIPIFTIQAKSHGREHHFEIQALVSLNEFVPRLETWVQKNPEQWTWNYPKLWNDSF